jgi:hypothetical protein
MKTILLAAWCVTPWCVTAELSLHNPAFLGSCLRASSSLSPPLTGMLLWLKADAISGKTNGEIFCVWTDSSGLGNSTTNKALTSTSWPKYLTGQINGLPAVYFNATNNNRLDLATMFTSETSAEVFLVLCVTNDPGKGNNVGAWHFAGTGDFAIYPYTDGVIYDEFATTVRKTVGNPTPALTAWNVYNTTSTNGEWTARLNRTQLFTTASNTFTNGANGISGTQRFLALQPGGTGGFNGMMAEIILYGRILSSTERTTTLSYLTNKYAGVLVF